MLRGDAHHQPPNRQLGVTEVPQEHMILAAMQFQATDPTACRQALDRLRGVIQAELEDDLADPAQETGELGYSPHHDDYRLSVTVGFSTTAYTKLQIAAEDQPVDLQPIPADILDSSGANAGAVIAGEGDVAVKICADDVYVTEHVLRRIEHELAADFTVVWVQTGAQRYNTRQDADPRKEARALIGFLDGTANLDPSKAEDRALIFTDHTRTDYPPLPVQDQYGQAKFPGNLRPPPGRPEPARLDGGTYMAVEVLLIKTAPFDVEPIPEQERVVGRAKQAGQPLPSQDPACHVLKSNPHRDATDELRRILRRGYPVIRPDGNSLARGLAFIAFSRSLSTQTEFIRRAWINNPDFPHAGAGQDLLLKDYVDPRLVCGGYYFVPPLEHRTQPWTWIT